MSSEDQTTAFLGILMLDKQFPRIMGHAGCTDSDPFPVRIERVTGAGARDIGKSGRPVLTSCRDSSPRRNCYKAAHNPRGLMAIKGM